MITKGGGARSKNSQNLLITEAALLDRREAGMDGEGSMVKTMYCLCPSVSQDHKHEDNLTE